MPYYQCPRCGGQDWFAQTEQRFHNTDIQYRDNRGKVVGSSSGGVGTHYTRVRYCKNCVVVKMDTILTNQDRKLISIGIICSIVFVAIAFVYSAYSDAKLKKELTTPVKICSSLNFPDGTTGTEKCLDFPSIEISWCSNAPFTKLDVSNAPDEKSSRIVQEAINTNFGEKIPGKTNSSKCSSNPYLYLLNFKLKDISVGRYDIWMTNYYDLNSEPGISNTSLKLDVKNSQEDW